MDEPLTRTRRDFLAVASAAVGSISLSSSSPLFGPTETGTPALSIQDVIDVILDAVPGAPREDSVDTFKSGDPSQQVTGVVTTFLATCQVIEKSAELGANLIITHEPTYYNHRDETEWLAGDQVYTYKRNLLDRTGIAVWRFHDYWHLHRPDGILRGILEKTGWARYAAADSDRRELPAVFHIPATTLRELAEFFKERLGISHPIQALGDPGMSCTRVGILPGAYGGRSQIEFLGASDVDVLVVGEINEWEISEYVRDARCAGRQNALLILGHANSEEPGMEWLADWLRPRIPGVSVNHIPARDPFILL